MPVLGSRGGGSSRGYGLFGISGPSGAPSSLAATAISPSQINLSWTNGDATAQTQIYRGVELITTVSAGVTSYSDTGRTPGTAYTYIVRHVKNAISSAASNSPTATTPWPTLSYSGAAAGAYQMSPGQAFFLPFVGTYNITVNHPVSILAIAVGGGDPGESTNGRGGSGGDGGAYAQSGTINLITGVTYTAAVGAGGYPTGYEAGVPGGLSHFSDSSGYIVAANGPQLLAATIGAPGGQGGKYVVEGPGGTYLPGADGSWSGYTGGGGGGGGSGDYNINYSGASGGAGANGGAGGAGGEFAGAGGSASGQGGSAGFDDLNNATVGSGGGGGGGGWNGYGGGGGGGGGSCCSTGGVGGQGTLYIARV